MGLRVKIASAEAHFLRKCVLFLWPGSRCSRSRFWGRSSSCDDETERERTAKRIGKMVSSALSSPATPSHTSQPRADWVWCFCSSCSARTLPTKAMRRRRLGVSACSKKSRKRAAACRARPRPRTQHRARYAPILAAACMLTCRGSSCGTFVATQNAQSRVQPLDRRPFDGRQARRALLGEGRGGGTPTRPLHVPTATARPAYCRHRWVTWSAWRYA